MKIEKLIKWVSLVLSICGLLLIFFPIQGMLILTRIAGVLLITLTVLGIFRQKAGTLISGSITLSFLSTTLGLILGVVLLIYPVETKSALTIIAGILIFVNALIKLRVAYLSYKEHLRGSGTCSLPDCLLSDGETIRKHNSSLQADWCLPVCFRSFPSAGNLYR